MCLVNCDAYEYFGFFEKRKFQLVSVSIIKRIRSFDSFDRVYYHFKSIHVFDMGLT